MGIRSRSWSIGCRSKSDSVPSTPLRGDRTSHSGAGRALADLVGRGDLGVNRKRMEQIRQAYQQQGSP